MNAISELAAAGFFFAAGLLAAAAAPDWIIGAAVGVCLLLVGTVLFQKGMKQLVQEIQAHRTEEREQTAKQFEKLQATLGEQKRYLEAVYGEVDDLRKAVDAAKTVCEEAQKAAKNTMQALDGKEEDQRRNIEKLCKKLDDTAKDICAKLNSQQTELQTFLKAENEANRKSMEQIMKNYSDVTAQDIKVLTALGEEVRHG